MTGEGSSMENNDRRYRETFDSTIRETLSQAVRIIAADPALVIPGTVILRHQRKAAAVRTRHEREGLLVPPVMIVSVTSRCNLVCTGCYMHERGERPDAEMSPEVLASVVEQAAGLGVSVIVLAGGEPLIRHEEIIRLARAHPRVPLPGLHERPSHRRSGRRYHRGVPEHRAGRQLRRLPGGDRWQEGKRGL